MKKILITGGAGFVGRRFVKYFLDRGDKVICVDNIAKFTGGINPKNGLYTIPMIIKISSFIITIVVNGLKKTMIQKLIIHCIWQQWLVVEKL